MRDLTLLPLPLALIPLTFPLILIALTFPLPLLLITSYGRKLVTV